MGISEKRVPAALRTLGEDSQRGTFGERGKRPKVEEKAKERLQALIHEMGMSNMLSCDMNLDEYRKLIDKPGRSNSIAEDMEHQESNVINRGV